MKTHTLLASALVVAFTLAATGTAAAADSHQHGAGEPTKLALDHGKKWPTDDANLHLIVAELLAGADAMQGKSKTTPAAGAAQAVRAVNQYGRYFDHAGWKPLA